jgi:uncharacterized protein (DUF2147 family)
LRFNFKSRALASILFALAGADTGHADPSGVWRAKDGGTIRVRPCGSGYCASIASVKPTLDPDTGKPWADKHNSDTHKRNRSLVGVPVLMSMKPSGPGKWSGRLYDSDSGQMYDGHLVEVDDSTITIEGCALGICGGENLSRLQDR